ncbi:porin [Burkholderia sp. IDO3]|uniref:porin n=1 Tax=Burkholderia sp. IDO3 TaxID=1705310 RepID=UPI000BBA5166|nr:porin [Burkholderia sp. IDO3]AXK62535.1 porin [Burkholderia sp. IDO3]PCD63209.1 porin [Burkholderia sp. IDO3]
MNKYAMAALPLALLGGMAHAQSSVTLYGAVDSGILYQSTSAATLATNARGTGKIFRFQDAGIYSSGWGIKGTEDLGGGYRALFQLQGSFSSGTGKSSINSTPGQSAIFNQVAAIGLSGPFGALTAGRQIVPLFRAMEATDVRGAQYFGSIFTALLGLNQAAGWPGTNTNAQIGAVYDDNALVYQSPAYRGFSFAAEYAPGGVAGHFQGGTRESVVMKYAGYGLVFAAAYYNGHDTNPYPAAYGVVPGVNPAQETGVDNNRFVYVGARYTTLGGISVSASYANARNPAHAERTNYDLFSAGLGYRLSAALTLTSGLYYLRSRNDAAPYAGSSTEIAVGADYRLSARTEIYAQVGHVNNKGAMNQPVAYGQPVEPGAQTTAAMIGVRHKF